MGGGPDFVDHWTRSAGGWIGDPTHLTIHVVPPFGAALTALAAEVRPLLAAAAGDVLEPVPDEWLHLTLQLVAVAPAVDPDLVAAVVAAVGARLAGLGPVPVTLRAPVAVDEGVLLWAHPGDPLRALRDEVRIGLAAVLGPDVPGPLGFHPHVSLAYAHASASGRRDAVTAALAPFAERTVELTVSSLALIAQTRRGRLYRWDPLADLRLGSA